MQVTDPLTRSAGYGEGEGYGYSSGDGYGHGYGDGDGFGNGFGDGIGDGYGDGHGNGDGCGYGYGNGDGYGCGYGHGDGNGYGDGHGDGSGDGDGDGSGDGDVVNTEPVAAAGEFPAHVVSPHRIAVGCTALSLGEWREQMMDLAKEHKIAEHEAGAALAEVERFLGIGDAAEAGRDAHLSECTENGA